MRAVPSMWRLVVLAVASAAALGGCSFRDAEPAPAVVEPGPEILAITTPPDASTTLLRRLDADTLAPRGSGVELGEYHDAWAFSPDRRTLAVGTFGRTGVRIIDVASLRIVRDIPMPIAVEGVGWIAHDRVAVLLQRGGVLVTDARTGQVLRRRPLPYVPRCQVRHQASTPHGVVFVVPTRRAGAIRLIRVSDGESGIRVVELRRVRAPSGRRTCGAAAFAVDPNGERALVKGPRGPIAEVDIASLSVRYRDTPRLRDVLGQGADCGACTGRRTAVWPTDETIAIAGVDERERRGARPTTTPAGAGLVNARTWVPRRLDRAAGDLASTGDGTLLTFGGTRSGVRATGLDGRRRWAALRGKRVRAAAVAGDRVYVLDDPPRITRVLDARTGAVIASRSMPLGRLDVLTGRTDAGDGLPSPGR